MPDDLGTSGDALHQLVMVLLELLPYIASAEGLTSELLDWKRRGRATETARELCLEERTAALEHLQKWEKLSEMDRIPRALGKAALEYVAKLRTWLARKCEATSQSCKGALEGALPGFQEASGGRRGGGHWQAALTESSKWDDVLREASYHLLTPDASLVAFSERLAALSTESAASVTALQEALSTSAACAAVGAATAGVTTLEEECKALVASAKAAIMSARVVDTEAFFCQD